MEITIKTNYFQKCLEHLYKRRQLTPNQEIIGSSLINVIEISEDDDYDDEYQNYMQNIADSEILQLLQNCSN